MGQIPHKTLQEGEGETVGRDGSPGASSRALESRSMRRCDLCEEHPKPQCLVGWGWGGGGGRGAMWNSNGIPGRRNEGKGPGRRFAPSFMLRSSAWEVGQVGEEGCAGSGQDDADSKNAGGLAWLVPPWWLSW